jgi:C1A family cysteine protease
MKLIVALCLLVVVSSLDLDELAFKKFIVEYERHYDSDAEYQHRLAIFKANVKLIRDHNARTDVTYTLGINKFADLTQEEFSQRFMGFKMPEKEGVREVHHFNASFQAPTEVDWVKKGAVNPVRAQENCGSCYAFSAVGAIEGGWQIKSGKLVQLSEQELVDCSNDYDNWGCNGGLMDNCFRYATEKGLCDRKSYPYQARQSSCRKSKCQSIVKVKKFVDVEVGNENALTQALAIAPVSIAIKADAYSFQLYSGGVYDDARGCGVQPNHGVLAVGYGKDRESGKLYYKVRNSWGTQWGADGYIYMARHETTRGPGMCGITSFPSYPTF